jgi:gallate decarboxylase subunit D
VAAPGTGESYSVSSFTVSVRQGRFRIVAAVHEIGPDILIAIWGGNRPHIGAIGMAQARQSLRDEEKTAATSSVFTLLGHKEDLIVKPLSEEITRRFGRNSVVLAGIHWDNLADDEIRTAEKLCQRLSVKIIEKLTNS